MTDTSSWRIHSHSFRSFEAVRLGSFVFFIAGRPRLHRCRPTSLLRGRAEIARVAASAPCCRPTSAPCCRSTSLLRGRVEFARVASSAPSLLPDFGSFDSLAVVRLRCFVGVEVSRLSSSPCVVVVRLCAAKGRIGWRKVTVILERQWEKIKSIDEIISKEKR
ncbi:hypothetical protein M5K25_013221 [Dendrobium thyrsiflorum]|uniref:Uncharacterized protein n=1 Tax=Dendrobium thyrsiflorum TaxID=117978 RepID=A0ABD0USH0_DENTH